MDLAFSPDGSRLVAGDNEGHVRAWNVDSLQILHTWNVPSAAANLAFSPDGRQIAIVNAGDGQITVLDPTRQEMPKPFLAQGCRAFSAAFRRDGRILTLGCDDGSLALFEVGTWQDLGRLRAYGEFVNALAPSPTENVIASATSDGRVLIWDLDELSWKRRACRRANRELPQTIPGWTGAPPNRCANLLDGAPPEPPGLQLDLAPAERVDPTRAVAQLREGASVSSLPPRLPFPSAVF
jgi:WD40 repeat protein